MANIDDTLLMNIKHAVDDEAALEAAADPADTTEDEETAVGDKAWLSGIHEINGDGPVDGYSPYKPTVLDSPYKPTVLDSPHPQALLQAELAARLAPSDQASRGARRLEQRRWSARRRGGGHLLRGGSRAWSGPAVCRARSTSSIDYASTSSSSRARYDLSGAPPTTPGAPGYLESSVLAEFSSLGSAFFVGGTGPGGD